MASSRLNLLNIFNKKSGGVVGRNGLFSLGNISVILSEHLLP
jgi:hypothetical protein